MKISTKLTWCALTAGSIAAFACTKAPDARPTTAEDVDTSVPATMTPASRTRTAAEQIAQARCEREQQCGNVGKDQSFSSSQDCLARIRNDWKDELNARECPGGINERELEECLTQVRAEACSSPFDTLARISECTSAQICIEEG